MDAVTFDPLHVLLFMGAGALGGLVRAVITGKGLVVLPRVVEIDGSSPHLNLGVLAPILVGALAGLLAPASLGVNGIISAMAGYAGTDFIENMVERGLGK